MSWKPFFLAAATLAALVAIVFFVFPAGQASSQPSPLYQPALYNQSNQCSQNACAIHCALDTYYTGYNGFDAFAGWYDTAYDITGCSDSQLKSDILLLIDIAAEVVEAPGGYTMNCAQMQNGQLTACYRNMCNSNYCRYAPDLDIDLTCDAGGMLDASFSNDSDNANTLNINNFLSIKRNDEGYTRIYNIPLNLGFSNWITNSGLPDCIPDANGNMADGCDLVLPFMLPHETTWSANDGSNFTWDGGLVDLSWFVTTDNGNIDSDLTKGIAVIKNDGDEFHVEMGSNLSGIALVYTYNYETDQASYEVQNWSATSSQVARFTVDECDEYSLCDAVETARDVDIYVIATSGQPFFILPGTYTFSLESSLKHDKDISDNKDTCSYEKSADEPPLTAPGFYHNSNLWYPADVYRVNVPAGSTAISMQLDGMQSGSDFDLYLQAGQMPSKNNYLCRPYRTGAADEVCTIDNPAPGDYYIVVDRFRNNGPYNLNIVVLPVPRTPTPTAATTPTPTPTPTKTRTPTITPLPPPCTVPINVNVYSYRSTYTSVPLEGATILMQADRNGPVFELGTTDAAGLYTGGRIIPSNQVWRVGVQKDGYLFDVTSPDGSTFTDWFPGCQTMGIEFTAQSTPAPTVTPTRTPSPTPITMAQVTFNGKTTWGDLTTPIQNAGITVEVYYPYTSNELYDSYHTTTNSNGYYAFTAAIPKDARVQISAAKTGYMFSPTWAGTVTSGTAQTLTYNFNTLTTITPTITRTPSKTPTPAVTRTATLPPKPTRAGTATAAATPAITSNNLWGWVHIENGAGIEGVRIVMQVNGSDALQVVDITDIDGNFKKYMTLTQNSTIKVWAEKEGYTFTPAYYEWVQGAAGTDHRMDFIVSSSPTSTKTLSPTRTPTRTRTITPTRTPTKTRTVTLTRTPTKTRTVTLTRTPTRTRTSTRTRTPTPVYSATPWATQRK